MSKLLNNGHFYDGNLCEWNLAGSVYWSIPLYSAVKRPSPEPWVKKSTSSTGVLHELFISHAVPTSEMYVRGNCHCLYWEITALQNSKNESLLLNSGALFRQPSQVHIRCLWHLSKGCLPSTRCCNLGQFESIPCQTPTLSLENHRDGVYCHRHGGYIVITSYHGEFSIIHKSNTEIIIQIRRS